MRIKQMNKWQKRISFLIASTLLLTVCVLLSFQNPIVQTAEQVRNEPYTIINSGAIVKRDLNNLFETSNLVAFCTITSEPDSFYVQRVDGGKEILSDQCAKVNQIIMGTPVSDTVVVRLRGGTVGNRTEIYEENPVLEVGKQYLLFLYQPGMGGAYHTIGNYYYVRGLHQGAYEVTENNEFVSSYGETLTIDSLIIPSTVTHEGLFSMREEYLENQKKNLENKVITQEFYDQAIDAINQYAVILSDIKAE